jgi:hypothetical protein
MCNVDLMKSCYEYSSTLRLNNCKIIRPCDKLVARSRYSELDDGIDG